MNKIYSFKKTLFAFVLTLISSAALAQPTVLGTQLAGGAYVNYDLAAVGGFKQYRLQATSSAAVSTRNWEFATGTAGAPNYTTNWRPYTGGNTLSANTFIPTSFANGAKYNTASGGVSGLLPAITSGNYYTFNVSNLSSADNVMQLLETSFNPVTISSVSQSPGGYGGRTVTITTSGTPNAAENIFVRYSTNSYTSSTIVQATGSVTTWTATIPWQSSAVSFYVYTSNKTLPQINADVTSYGQGVHDMSTLDLNNNGGSNYSWTPAATNPDGGFESGSTFATNGWTVVNHTTNTWQVGAASTPFAGTNAAYISNDGGTTYSYTNSLLQTSHFYRDITVPAGETKITLSFLLKGNGESGYDRLLVYIAPTSVTPVAGTPASNSTVLTGAALVYTQTTFPIAAYATQTILLPTSLAGSTFRLIFTWQNDGSLGTTPPASLDNISLVSAVPANITSNAVSGNWSATTTWVGGVVPGAGDNVTIVNGATVTIDASAANPIVGDLTVGGGTTGTLIYNSTAAQTLSVLGNLTVNSGATLSTAATGTITTHIIDVNGNITNSGIIDLSTNTNTAGATLKFSGFANSTFSGTGATNDLYILLMNKAPGQIADLNLSNFSVRGSSSAATGALLTSAVGTGTVKFSGTNTFSGVLWSSTSYTVASSMGIWLNNANFTVTGQAASPTMSGLLRMTAGTYNVGTLSGNAMGGASTSSFIIEGGTMNFSGRLNVSSSGASFNMSAGTINVTTVGNGSSATAGFGFTSSTSVFTMSGGTINLVQRSTGSTVFDYQVSTASPTITGGTLNIGTAATATNFNFGIQGAMPNVVVDNTTNNKTANLVASATAYGTTTINSGATLNLNGFTYQERASTFTNNGTLTGTTASSRLSFFSPTVAAQTFAGSGTVTAPLDGLSVQNGGLTISHTNAFQTLRVILFAGTITNSNKITLGSGAAAAVTVQIGVAGSTQVGGSFDVAPVMNLGTGTYTVLYLGETAARTTGFEMPATRILTAATISNANNVTVAGGALNIGTLTLQAGKLITSTSNLVTITGTTTTSTVRSTFTSAAGATSSGTTVTVTSTTNLVVGMNVTVSAGVGAFAAGTTVTSITNSTTFVVSATPTTPLSGGASVVSGIGGWVTGPLALTLPASLLSGSTYAFPIGKGTYNSFELVNPTTTAGGTVVVQAEAFDANSGGTAGLFMGSLNTDRYWSASIASGAANFTNSFIKLTDASVVSASAIASSSTVNGTYDIVGNTSPTVVVGSSVTSAGTASTSIPGFYVLGLKAVPMVYTSSTTTQTVTTPIIKPATNQQIIGVQIVTTGNASPLTLTGIDFNTNGSTSSAADVSNARIWYTGTSSTFATTTQFGADVPTPPAFPTVTAVLGSQVLAEGTNYFWLVYDVPAGATVNNLLDAECTSINIGGALTPSTTAPAGTRIIKAALNGTYVIGASQTAPNYTVLTNAISDLNAYGVTGPVTFQLASDYSSNYVSAAGATSAGTTITVTSTTNLAPGMAVTVTAGTGAFAANTTVVSVTNATTFIVSAAPTTALSGGASVVTGSEVYPLTINAVTGGNSTNTVTIVPTAAARTVTGSSASAILVLNGADYVTINGSTSATANTVCPNVSATRDLTITNTNAGTSSAVVWLQTNIADGATNCTIKNCNLVGNSNATTLFALGSGSSSISTTSLGTGNNNNSFINNNISKTQNGIFSFGASAASKNTGTTINQNLINTASPNNVAFYGILTGYEDNITISGNNVAGMTAATSPDVSGISVGYSYSGISTTSFGSREVSNATITYNKVNNITNTGGFSATGIQIGQSSTGTTSINNNAISVVNSNGTGGDYGAGLLINSAAGSTLNVFFNSVYMSGGTAASLTTTGGNYSLAIGGTSAGVATDVRNNIFANTTTTNMNGYAIGIAYSTFTGLTLGNNNYFKPVSGNFVLGRTGSLASGTNVTALPIIAGESGSITTDPLFNSTTNLTLQLGSPAVGTGVFGTGITSDIICTSRSNPPSMGAYEVAVDAAGPAISYTVFSNTISTTDRTLTPVAITDPSGVETGAGIKPRLYFKKSGDLNTYAGNTIAFNGWKYIETSSSGSPFDFTTMYSLLQTPVVVGDVIQYFVVAQDMAGTPNVGINSGTFFATPASVALTSAAFPMGGTINSYLITPSISGIKTVCPSGCDFPSLTLAGGAFATINAATVVGDVTLQIAGDLPSETGFVLLEEFAAPYTITIKPTGVPRTITGTSADGLIKLNGADRVTIDGSLGSTVNSVCPQVAATRDLTINNTNTGTSSVVIWLKTNISNGATNNTIKNCNVVGSGPALTLCGIFSGSSSISLTSLGTGNNNNSIVNNNISRTQLGIYSQGASAAAKNTGNTINQNLLNTASPNNIGFGGILLGFEDNLTVSGNRISGMAQTGSTDVYGISVGFAGSSILFTATTGNEVTNATISKNVIDGLNNTNTLGYSAVGIAIASAATGTTTISNNMISNVRSYATPFDVCAGILIGGGAATTRLYFNTVNLTGVRSSGASGGSSPSYALGLNGTTPNIDIQNNIFMNSTTSGNASPGRSYSVGLGYTSTLGNYANLISDNNNCYVSGPQAMFAKVGSLTQGSGTDIASLAAWRVETGRDLLSKNADVVYASSTDLHINNTVLSNVVNLNATGATGTGITDDIDCDARGSFPDIGADQFGVGNFWTGVNTTNWTTGTNWGDLTVPSNGADIIIPTGVVNNPVLAGATTIGALSIGTGTTLSLNGQTFTINGAFTGTGTLTGSTTSNLVVNGTAGTLQFTSGSTNNYLRNLDLGAAGSMTIGSNGLNIAAGATPGVVTIATGGVLTTGGNLTLKSDANGTARIASNTSGGTYVSGNVTVERYISAVGRKWRLLSGITTTTTQTIYQSWQESAGPANGLGTWITSGPTPLPGYDGTSQNTSSILSHNQGGASPASWVTPSVTNSGSINTNNGYMLFVRGDRGDLPGNATNNPTVLRTTGTLRQGNQAVTVLGTAGNGNTLLGNPFASPIDLENIFVAAPTNLDLNFAVWDATLTGNYGVGGYRTVQYNSPGNYTVTPSTGSAANDNALRLIRSGQGFFMHATAANANFNIQESYKTASVSVINPIVTTPGDQQVWVNMNAVNPGAASSLVDGMRVRFDGAYSASNSDDIQKMSNFGENISSYRNSNRWAVEMRPMIVKQDTIFMRTSNLRVKDYELVIGSQDFTQTNITAWLQDTWLNVNTPISLNPGAVNTISINVTSNPASANPDRFRIVFTNNASQLPPTITKVKATQQGSDITVEWKVTSQQNMAKYEVEKSINGTNFAKVNSQDAVGINGSDMTYNWLDQQAVVGDNYYRIRSIGFGGEVKISQVVKVSISKGNPAITVYPNPVINRNIVVQFNGMEKGIYQLRLINTVGQPVYTQSISHAGGSAMQTLRLNGAFANGNYQLEIGKPDNTKTVRSLTINE